MTEAFAIEMVQVSENKTQPVCKADFECQLAGRSSSAYGLYSGCVLQEVVPYSISRQVKVKNEMQSKAVPWIQLGVHHPEAQDHCSADTGM